MVKCAHVKSTEYFDFNSMHVYVSAKQCNEMRGLEIRIVKMKIMKNYCVLTVILVSML